MYENVGDARLLGKVFGCCSDETVEELVLLVYWNNSVYQVGGAPAMETRAVSSGTLWGPPVCFHGILQKALQDVDSAQFPMVEASKADIFMAGQGAGTTVVEADGGDQQTKSIAPLFCSNWYYSN